MSAIKAVTFDLWQTLLFDEQERGGARARFRVEGSLQALQQAGYAFPPERIWEAYQSCTRTCLGIRERGEDVAFSQQIEMFIERIAPGLLQELEGATVGLIATRYADSFHQCPPHLHPKASEVLQEVKNAGYRLGLISNTGVTPGTTLREYLEQRGVLRFFDVLTFSDEARLAKPSMKIFQRTAKALGVRPGEAVHVGDQLLNDVVGASQARMKTIWLRGFDQGQVDAKPDVTIDDLGEVGSALSMLSQAS